MASPVILAFGGTSGIGASLAAWLVGVSTSPSPILHIVGRSQSAAEALISTLRQSKPGGSYTFHPCDLSLISETKKLCEKLGEALPVVNYCTLSQGILTTAGRTETREGNDVKMMLHYYSRMLVVQMLRKNLEAGNARVMSVLDSLRGDSSKLVWEDLDLKTHYSLGRAANHCMAMNDIALQVRLFRFLSLLSRLADSLYLQHFASQSPGVQFFHAYPSVVQTDIGRNLPWYFRYPAAPIGKLLGVSAEECAKNMGKPLLVEPKMDKSESVGGAYFVDNKGKPVMGKKAASAEEKDKVIKHTDQLLGL